MNQSDNQPTPEQHDALGNDTDIRQEIALRAERVKRQRIEEEYLATKWELMKRAIMSLDDAAIRMRHCSKEFARSDDERRQLEEDATLCNTLAPK